MLREQGIIAREISVERLDTDRVILSRLVLEQEEGTRYVQEVSSGVRDRAGRLGNRGALPIPETLAGARGARDRHLRAVPRAS